MIFRSAIVGFLAAISLIAYQIYFVSRFTVITATVKDVRESEAICARRSGREEICTHFDVRIWYERDGVAKEAQVGGDGRKMKVSPGDSIKVFVRGGDTDDVRVDLYRQGWKLPLTILFASLLICIVSSRKRPAGGTFI